MTAKELVTLRDQIAIRLHQAYNQNSSAASLTWNAMHDDARKPFLRMASTVITMMLEDK